MKRNSMHSRPWLVLALVATFLAVAVPALAQNAPVFADVELELATGSTPCATATPDEVTIYSPGDKFPRGVKWTVVNKDPNHQWVLRQKEGSTAPGFGPKFVIPCGSETPDWVRSGIDNKPGTWRYSLLVYECENGQPKSDPICDADPVVTISDPPDDV